MAHLRVFEPAEPSNDIITISIMNTLRQAAQSSLRNTRAYSGARGRLPADKLAAMAETNGAHFKREAAIAMGLGIVVAFAWKLSVADPIRRSIDNYYAEYDKRLK
jgi:hypothetical protein